MILRYAGTDGKETEVRLGVDPVTVGRDETCTIRVRDPRASRFHCTVFQKGTEFLVRDENSKNGTRVNEETIEEIVIAPGDMIRVGSTVLSVKAEPPKGEKTLFGEVQKNIEEGKGFGTILREIVDEMDEEPSDDSPSLE